jgi:hypothetical protein
VFHLTGYRPVGESLCVLQRNGQPTLIVTPEWEAERAEARASAGLCKRLKIFRKL